MDKLTTHAYGMGTCFTCPITCSTGLQLVGGSAPKPLGSPNIILRGFAPILTWCFFFFIIL